MLEFLFKFMDTIYPLSDEVKRNIEHSMEIIEVPKNHLLLREDQRCDHIFVVISGVVRMYYIKDGQEVCSRFAEEQQLCLPVNSFFSRVKSYEYIETIVPCTIARIHYDKLQQLYKDHIEFNYVARVFTEHYFIRSEERLFLLRKQSAEERYLFLCKQYPPIIQRVPLKYIASYLGITLETLSRIRKKISLPQ